MSEITILRLIEGAKQAKGLTVIIDVFRAFSLECFLYDKGVKQIRPVGSIEEAVALHEMIGDSVLIGERHGKKVDGFDFGNSPSSVTKEAVDGKTVIHTTSAGTQGIVSAVNADEIITGSLVNAKAIAQYIKMKNPSQVSLVCMGNEGIRIAKEDELCAEYIRSLVLEEEFFDFEERLMNLQFDGGDHFFNPKTQEIFPEPDFWLCIQHDIFPFIIQVKKDEYGFITKKLEIKGD